MRRDSFLVDLYRRLTTLYPGPFRDEYQAQMVDAARDRASERRGPAGALWLAAELIADVFSTAPKEHWHMFKQDLRHALRVLRNTPAVTLTAILVLAIGIGSAAAVFAVVNAVLLRPFPFADPDRLGALGETALVQHTDFMGPAFGNLLDYRNGSKLVESVGWYSEAGFAITGQGDPERVDGAWVSASLLPVLGVAPALGRNFAPEEDAPKSETALIISHGFWQRRFGGDPGVLGRTLNVNGRKRTIVGVMPPGFAFPEKSAVWAPIALDPKDQPRTNHFLQAICRLRPGVSFEQATAELQSILRGIQARFPDTSDLGVTVLPLRQNLAGEYRPALVRLLAAVGLVLAIACTNIMNLLLARAAVRSREVAIRTALGANRRRIIRQLLTESMVLGAAGAAVGLALALAALRALPRFSPVDLPYWIDLGMDWRVAMFLCAATAGSVLLFGLAPAIKSSGVQPAAGLSEMRRGVTSGLSAGRLRQALVAVQVALSVVLLVGAGLMMRSLANLARFDLGFRGGEVLSYRISMPNVRYDEPARREAFQARMRARLRELPGVRNVATASALPSAGGWWRTLQRDARGSSRPGDLPIVYHVVVSPGYFGVMGIPVEAGRDFTDADGPAAPVVIVSRRVADLVWPGRDPVGQKLRIDPFLPDEPERTVVGVVGNVRAQGARNEVSPALYVPEAYSPILNIAVLLRGDGPPQALAQSARSAMRELDPELPVYSVRTVEAAVAERSWTFRFFTYLLASFAAIALLLAAVGLGGIMAHIVIERTHEIGVRVALGATARDVVGMILTRGMALVAAGAAAGLIAAVAATRVLASELFGVKPTDAPTLVLVVAVLAGAAFVAAWLPARRAARVDPAVALRWD